MALTKKQKEIFDYICSYYQENGHSPTQREIKEEFNFKSFGSVQRYIKYLTEAELLVNDWNARRGLRPVIVEEQRNENEIALLGDVAAGIPIEAIENPENTIEVPSYISNKKGKLFALNIVGDSMIEDGILNGDVIVCRHQKSAEQGQTVVAVVDGEATVKNFFNRKGLIELHPANSSMRPFIIDPLESEVSIAGVLVGLIRAYE